MIQFEDVAYFEDNLDLFEDCDAICVAGEGLDGQIINPEQFVGNFDDSEVLLLKDFFRRHLLHNREAIADNLLYNSNCPFCYKSLIYSTDEWSAGEDIAGGDIIGIHPLHQETQVWVCRYCTFWQAHIAEQHPTEHIYYVDLFFGSKLKEFNRVLPDGVSSELALLLRRKPDYWHNLAPKRLETFVADIFRANYEHAEVAHIGRPDDGGVDVVFVESKNKEWLIQVKRRKNPNNAEGVETIRSVLGSMILNNSQYGAIVSTASHFSHRAKQAVEHAEKAGYLIKLYDKGKLDRMIGKLLPFQMPWEWIMNDFAEETAQNHIKWVNRALQWYE